MCAPAVAAVPLFALAAGVGAVTSVVGGVMQANAAREQAEIAARQSEMNAAAQRRNADMERVAAQFQARQEQEAARRLLGAQRNQAAANGVLIDQGSMLDLQVDSQTEAAMDRAAIEWSANQRAGNLRYAAQVDDWNAGASRRAGATAANNALFGGITGGITSVIGGGINIANAGGWPRGNIFQRAI